MKGKILITDSLFISAKNEKAITDAGYEIERLDKPEASEEELIEAVKGKIGYILGGIEHVTKRVIDAGDELKAIVFTGIAYKNLIPAWEYATKKGIAIANAPDGPTHAVAEWAITMALAMNREIFDLGRAGEKAFGTTVGFEDQNVGIIGLGRIGTSIAKILKVFRPTSISYYSRHRHENVEQELNAAYKDLNALLKESDVIFLCVSSDVGKNFIDKDQLSQIKNGALLVNFLPSEIINEDALLKELDGGRIRAVSDNPAKNEAFKKLPLKIWYSFNGSNAFNTKSAIKLTSDMATQSMINLLSTGSDKNRVN